MLCNLRGGATAYAVGLEERMDYLETRISELTSTQDDHKSAISAIKGLQERVSVGFGLRTSFTTTEDRAGTKGDGVSGGRSYDNDFDVENMRLYFGAKVTDNIYVEFNTEISNTDAGAAGTGVSDDVRLLDAFVEYKWNDYFHIRFGRHLPASDRFNLDGPYYQNSFDFPDVVQRYPNKSTGRVEGISYWGQYAGGKFKWQFTASEGTEVAGGPNDDPDHLQYSGRLTYNFWEPEPGFYNSSTFYGKKDVLAIGLVGFQQSDAVGTAAEPSDFTGWNFDFLLEKNFGWGTIDIEAAYFDYNNHKAAGSGSLADGQAWEAGFSYLYPEKIGWGYPQFVSRYQSFDPTDNLAPTTAFTESKIELALHYIIQGHNAKIALIWSNTHLGNSPSNEDVGAIKLGMQLQH
ncbi:MAG: hypothetical protein JYX80_05315 [Candidatus Scalindua sediminis]|nr:hypothetical protein [Candidatus Scalindua sediminis]